MSEAPLLSSNVVTADELRTLATKAITDLFEFRPPVSEKENAGS
jgi:hypothetical protein